MRFRTCSCIVLMSLPMTALGVGADKEKAADGEPNMYVGGAVVISSKPYEGIDAHVYPVPLFAYEGRRVYLRGTAGGYRLWSGEGWSIGPVLQPRLDGYDQDDSPTLAGMDDRDWSVDGGVGVSWLTRVGLFGLSFVTDLLGRHQGQEFDFSYTARFKLAKLDFIPSAGVRWKSENLVDYYFGVEPDEVRPDRPAYEGAAATDPYLKLAVRRKLNEHWSLLGTAQYEWLDDAITDSPIVDSDYELSFLAGLLYSW